MSENTLTMTAMAKEQFLSGDDGRGAIRRTAAELFPGASEVRIVDEEGNLFDTVSGSEATDETLDDRAVIVPTDEQIHEKGVSDALEAADLARVEAEVRPQVFARLKDEARQELRSEYRDQIRQLLTEKTELAKKVARLSEGMAGADRLLREAREENSILKARFSNLSEEYETLKADSK